MINDISNIFKKKREIYDRFMVVVFFFSVLFPILAKITSIKRLL